MTQASHPQRRESTLVRDARIRELYGEIVRELGPLATEVSRSYYYRRIRERTGLSHRTISGILNAPAHDSPHIG